MKALNDDILLDHLVWGLTPVPLSQLEHYYSYEQKAEWRPYLGGFTESIPYSKKKDQTRRSLKAKGQLRGLFPSPGKMVKVFRNCTMKNKSEVNIEAARYKKMQHVFLSLQHKLSTFFLAFLKSISELI